MRFTFLTGDVNWLDYGGTFVSRKMNNGEFDYWLVIEVINWEDAVGEHEAKSLGTYNVSLSIVAPSEIDDETRKGLLETMGMDDYEGEINELTWVMLASDYGCQAQIWNESGNNLRNLMREAHRQADINGIFFGFQMDRAQNAVGSTGWDFVRGDVLAGLDRYRNEMERAELAED